MINNLLDIEEFRTHIVEECVCVKCGRRWIDVRPKGTWLKDLECPGCHRVGFVVASGQELDDDDEDADGSDWIQ